MCHNWEKNAVFMMLSLFIFFFLLQYVNQVLQLGWAWTIVAS